LVLIVKTLSGIKTNFKRNRRKNVSGTSGVFFMDLPRKCHQDRKEQTYYSQSDYFDEVFCSLNLTAVVAVFICTVVVKDGGGLSYGKNNRKRNTSRQNEKQSFLFKIQCHNLPGRRLELPYPCEH
jgi:hypothetical protein